MAAASDETIVVGIGLVWNGDKLAIGVRATDSPLPGFSEFPGGKCNPGELPMQAVVRECLEEMGIPVQVLGPRVQAKHQYPHGLVELHFFDCRAIGDGELKPPFEWKTVMELGALTFPEANAELMKDLAERPKPR